jgi:hypothetical protein
MSGLLPTRSPSDSNSSADINALSAPPIVSITNQDYTIDDSTTTLLDTLLVTTGGANRTITLPTAVDNNQRVISIIKIDSDSGEVIVDGEGSETINGATTQTLSDQYSHIRIKCDGSNWYILTNDVQSSITVDATPTSSVTNAISSRFLQQRTFQGDYAEGGADPWVIEFIGNSNVEISSPANSTWYNPTGYQITLTPGTWKVYYYATLDFSSVGNSTFLQTAATLSTSNNSESTTQHTSEHRASANNTFIARVFNPHSKHLPPITVGSNTTYYLNIWGDNSTSTNSFRIRGSTGSSIIRAERIY